MTEPYRAARLTGQAATRYGNLMGLKSDLAFVVVACERLIALLDTEEGREGRWTSEDADIVIKYSLWSASLVAYARCFRSGIRKGLDDSIFSTLPGDAKQVHEYFLDVRDKHIAHSVSPFEQHRIGVLLPSEQSEASEVIGTVGFTVLQLFPDQDGVRSLQRLAHLLVEQVSGLIDDVIAEVEAEARSVPIEELYRRPSTAVTLPDPTDAGNARS